MGLSINPSVDIWMMTSGIELYTDNSERRNYANQEPTSSQIAPIVWCLQARRCEKSHKLGTFS